MPDRKRWITIGGTLFAIAGIGFFMQNGQPGPSQAGMNISQAGSAEMLDLSGAKLTASSTFVTSGTVAPPTPKAPPPEQAATQEAPIEIAARRDDAPTTRAPVTSTPSVIRDEAVAPVTVEDQDQPQSREATIAALDDPAITAEPEANRSALERTTSESGNAQGCGPSVNVETMAAALINVIIHAQCLPNERVTLEHAGMIFSEATNADGMLEVTVPALSEEAEITATFRDGHTVSAKATVGSLAFYDRAVIQSVSHSAVTLHALEYGANYSDRGHIWSGAAGGIENAATGKGGFLISLGDPGIDNARIAEVYTFPTGIAQGDGKVELSVEIEVTERNCGRHLSAEALQTRADSDLSVQSLDLTMPDCDAVGDFLVLKNLVNDLTVARN